MKTPNNNSDVTSFSSLVDEINLKWYHTYIDYDEVYYDEEDLPISYEEYLDYIQILR